MISSDIVLSIRELSVSFLTDGPKVQATHRIGFDIPKGQTVALVGESGCGKSVTAQAVLGILLSPPAVVESGEILFEGRDLRQLPEREMQSIRGNKIAMVFQEPMTSLNPVYTVGAQIVEAIRLHRRVTRFAAQKQAVELLRKVGFAEPEIHVKSYPHELSGGMRQRAMIAMAICCEPALLIADEPTTSVDMITQAQILDVLMNLQRERTMSLLLIAHDLSLVSEIADKIVVLYAGTVVEQGPCRAVLSEPAHPYTRALLAAQPSLDTAFLRAKENKSPPRLPTIAGTLPDLRTPPSGCRFYERCGQAFARCKGEWPSMYAQGQSRARCFLWDPERAGRDG